LRPITIGKIKLFQTIRSRIREPSISAEARRADGSALVLLPHDCRRVFASEHLNNNTPVHVIQDLLGHASPETVMIYAKLYPADSSKSIARPSAAFTTRTTVKRA
jgi:integrase